MIRKIIPLLLAIVAAAVGLFGGEALRADPRPDGGSESVSDNGLEATEPAADETKAEGSPKPKEDAKKTDATAYFRFPSQFFVPVMHGDRLDAVMILTLTLEIPAERQEAMFSEEFRLRDSLLRTLLVHANTGGFDGNYTIEPRMRRLRESLLNAAQEAGGDSISEVLIEDIAQQQSA